MEQRWQNSRGLGQKFVGGCYSRLQFDSTFSKKRTQYFLFTCGARHLGRNCKWSKAPGPMELEEIPAARIWCKVQDPIGQRTGSMEWLEGCWRGEGGTTKLNMPYRVPRIANDLDEHPTRVHLQSLRILSGAFYRRFTDEYQMVRVRIQRNLQRVPHPPRTLS